MSTSLTTQTNWGSKFTVNLRVVKFFMINASFDRKPGLFKHRILKTTCWYKTFLRILKIRSCGFNPLQHVQCFLRYWQSLTWSRDQSFIKPKTHFHVHKSPWLCWVI
jgi:hypothetical protein